MKRKSINERTDHPAHYSPSGKRGKQFDQTQKDLKKADELRKKGKAKQAKELEQRAYRRRDRMEKKERNKKSFKNVPRKDTKKAKNESLDILREYVRAILIECKLSKKTEKTIRNKAEKKGYTYGSVRKEYCSGDVGTMFEMFCSSR